MGEIGRRTLELWSDRSMPGSERHQLGGWVLRADRGATGRANSVWPTGKPDRPVGAAVDAAERWYADRGRRTMFQLFDGVDPDLGAELDHRGYLEVPGALVMVAPIAAPEAETAVAAPAVPAPAGAGGVEVRCATSPSPAFATLVDDDDRLAEMASAGLVQRYVTAHASGGSVLGGGLGTLDGDGFGVFAMRTVEAARRRGVATLVLAELRRAGHELGASTLWLQVMADNTAARALYRREGLEVVHGYRYRASPPGS
ncbi:MAG: GNAT family N-acetyltransferase [Actinomycetota bacterium]|nr:GNAT family N-acetyltransferase [Actinomycetota bacterium]